MKVTGHVGMKEPFEGLFTQGMVVHETYRKADGEWVMPAEVKIEAVGDKRVATLITTGEPIEIGHIEKMSKSQAQHGRSRRHHRRRSAPTPRAGSCCRIRRPSAT